MINAPRIIDRDHGYRRLFKTLQTVNEGEPFYVGVVGDEETQKAALFNEFGLGVPERSFLRSWFDENARRLLVDLKSVALAALFQDKDRKELLRELGERYVKEIRQKIEARIPPPNAPSTIAKKGSDVPLIDTRKLLDAIHALIGADVVA